MPTLGPFTPQSSLTHSNEVLTEMISCLYANVEEFTHLHWKLFILENADLQFSSESSEKRTQVVFCGEEFTSPVVFPLQGDVAKDVFMALKENETVRKLVIQGHYGFSRLNFTPNIRDDEMQLLSEVIESSFCLEYLDLSCNYIENSGATLLAQALKGCPTIQTIILKYNLIGVDGLVELAEAIKDSPNLIHVDVSQQLARNMGSLVLQIDPYHKFVASMIDDSFKRRKELLTGQYFAGIMNRTEATSVLQSTPKGTFVCYMEPTRPFSLTMSCSTGSDVTHMNVHRVDQGYTFACPYDAYPPASLQSHALWKYLSTKERDLALESQFAPQLDYLKTLFPTWSLRSLPSKEDCKLILAKKIPLTAYPTLSVLIMKNQQQFVTPLRPKFGSIWDQTEGLIFQVADMDEY